MSELQQQDNRNKRGGIRSKKLSTRIDLTPMVDLGFLLITFFIFTTTMNEAKGLSLIVPDETPTKDVTTAAESKTISLILQNDDVIHYYHGLDQKGSQSTNYSIAGLRAIIQQKIREVKERFGSKADAIILIKPTDGASYRNIVTVLDEMLINDVKKYVLMEPSAEEKSL
ncbi:MAG: biopolymer transporter ExbD [Sediminibacterium sp.]|nr:biopolymer transporter ExbD [Sediminibacterium sp.]